MLPVKINLNKGNKTFESPVMEQLEKDKTQQENEIRDSKFQDVKINPNKTIYDPKNSFKVKYVSGGYGHTAAITGKIKF